MAGALDGSRELALLLGAEAGFGDRLDTAIGVDVSLQILDVFVVKICGGGFLIFPNHVIVASRSLREKRSISFQMMFY